MKFFLTLFFTIILVSCNKSDPVTGKVENIEPNVFERGRKAAQENPILTIGGGKQKNTNFEFSTSNVLWRATLKSLDFLPLLNTDYSGGIIIYDWYSEAKNSKEQVKISVQFLDSELRSDSIKVIAHKRICETLERCSNSALDQSFSNSIKESIITSARALKIEEAKKERK